jgi:hypothetical protein
MKIELTNKNYCATVIAIQNVIPLENCDNVVHTSIMGNLVVVSKDIKIGELGLFFPVECQLSKEYLSANNLYRNQLMNIDTTQKGYFEDNGRIRCVKFRGHNSEGLFMPLTSLDFITEKYPEINTEFNSINGVEICKKYIIRIDKTSCTKKDRNKNMKKYKSKLIDNQFRFHLDTSVLYKNLDEITPDSLISITYKIHGTSIISSYILCKKPLKWYEKILKKIGVNVVDTHYDYIWSSRKVIKNSELNPNAEHYYEEDIWGIAHKELKPFLQKGMTIYAEIAGYLPTGSYIQSQYDYGCLTGQHKVFVYRITQTNVDGKVIEFSAKQVQEWCKLNGLLPVPELFYGYAKDCFTNIYHLIEEPNQFEQKWNEEFLIEIKKKYNEKDCYMCINKVPEEGCVVRLDNKFNYEAFKQKSTRFFEGETKMLDKGIIDIEENN